MSVTVSLPGALRPLAGGAARVALDAPVATVGDVLAALFALHPALRDRVLNELGQVRPHVNVFVGVESIRLGQGLATPATDGDVIAILPAVSGG